jgi:hypothetical protein
MGGLKKPGRFPLRISTWPGASGTAEHAMGKPAWLGVAINMLSKELLDFYLKRALLVVFQ